MLDLGLTPKAPVVTKLIFYMEFQCLMWNKLDSKRCSQLCHLFCLFLGCWCKLRCRLKWAPRFANTSENTWPNLWLSCVPKRADDNEISVKKIFFMQKNGATHIKKCQIVGLRKRGPWEFYAKKCVGWWVHISFCLSIFESPDSWLTGYVQQFRSWVLTIS